MKRAMILTLGISQKLQVNTPIGFLRHRTWYLSPPLPGAKGRLHQALRLAKEQYHGPRLTISDSGAKGYDISLDLCV